MSLTSLTTGISDYATRRAIQQLASKLNYDASPTFAGLTISGEALSSTLITQWSTAYSWGDHAGLYDTIGAASGEIDDHESTYDHSLLHSPVTLDALTGITLTGQQLSYTAGYAIPTTAKQAEWDSAYTHKTTEDAINGLVSCDGSGAYTAKVIGTDVQAYDADLAAIAALTPTDGNIIVGDGSTWVAESGATARTSLGLGTTDSPTFTNLTLSTTSSADVPLFDCADATANYTPWFRNDGRSVELTIDSFRDSTSGSFLAMRHARGSVASPAILKNNDEVAAFFARAYDGVSAWRNAAGLMFIVDDNPTEGYSPPTSIRFYVSNGTTTSWQWAGAFQYDGKFGVGTLAPQEGIHCTTKIRSNAAFNLNGTDGVTQVASAGTVCDVTALAGGIATAQTQVTYIADGAHSLSGITSITTINGRITAMA